MTKSRVLKTLSRIHSSREKRTRARIAQARAAAAQAEDRERQSMDALEQIDGAITETINSAGVVYARSVSPTQAAYDIQRRLLQKEIELHQIEAQLEDARQDVEDTRDELYSCQLAHSEAMKRDKKYETMVANSDTAERIGRNARVDNELAELAGVSKRRD